MKSFLFKMFLLITVLAMSNVDLLAQYTWTKYTGNPVIPSGPSGSWYRAVITPCVIYNADSSRYEMWFAGSPTTTGLRPHRIGFAYSSDGISWQVRTTAVLEPRAGNWDNYTVNAPYVIRENNQYKMWYTAEGPNYTTFKIGYATSPDGINWTRLDNPIMDAGTADWEAQGVGICSVLPVSGGYKMWYSGLAGSTDTIAIGHAVSTDGITWQRDTVNNPILRPGTAGQWDDFNIFAPRVIILDNIYYMYYGASRQTFAQYQVGLATSTDGVNWEKYSDNPVLRPSPSGWDNGEVETACVIKIGNTLKLWYDGSNSGTYHWQIGLATSPIQSAIWQEQNSNFPSNVLIVDFSSVNSQVCWAVGQVYPGTFSPYPGYIKTIDGGENWILNTIPGIPDGYLQQIFAIDADTAYITVYVESGQSSKGIYKTTDGGLTWNKQTAYNTSLFGPGYIHFFDSQNGVVIGDPNLETYTTTNGGVTWNPVTMPSTLSDEYTWLGESRITAVGNTVWFSTNYRLFQSTDKGYTWTFLFNEQQYFGWLPSIAFQDNQTGIYALKISGFGTDHIYKKTTDGGTTWSTLSNSILDNLAPSCIQHIPGTNSVYVAVGGRTPTMRGTAVTYDAGESWTLIDTVGVFLINFVNDQFGWGSQYATNIVYKYVGPRIISSVEEERIDLIPTGYLLSQNYPNPFNPSTTFRYSIPTQSKVVIKVYGILGNEVATLMDEEKSVGTYELTWNAVNLPSGVYFYQIKAGEYVNTKKMILLK